jgi:acetolactate synthase-1/3 small subunit
MAPIKKSHTITLRVIDQPGVLVRVAQVFTRRSFNIDSLQVKSVSENEKQADIIITAHGDSQLLHQVTMQLQKIINVLDVTDSV